jgi:hypothetical protein
MQFSVYDVDSPHGKLEDNDFLGHFASPPSLTAAGHAQMSLGEIVGSRGQQLAKNLMFPRVCWLDDGAEIASITSVASTALSSCLQKS